MAYIREFGRYLPARIVSNAEIGAMAGSEPEWIVSVSGIEERRFAGAEETVAAMAAHAARQCLERAGVAATSLGMILVSSGSSERRFPGPASEVAHLLGLDRTPALDVPVASAGSLFALELAARLSQTAGDVLVVASEKMSSVALTPPMERGVAVLFGDGAGACLVSPGSGRAKIIDAELASDGAFAADLRLEFGAPLAMDGRSVILQASRKIPRAIAEVLERNGRRAGDVDVFLMHQANRNLIVRVAQALGVAEDRFYTNIRRYGNTSSASMLLAASEWLDEAGFRPGAPVIFAAFGAGFHWGAMLVEGV